MSLANARLRNALAGLLLAYAAFLQDSLAQSTPARALGQTEAPDSREEIRRALAISSDAVSTVPDTGLPSTPDQSSELIPWWEGHPTAEGTALSQKSWSTIAKVEMGVDRDDNVRIDENDAESTTGFFVRPTIGLNWGREDSHLMLSAVYTPEFQTYDGGDVADTLNQSASLSASLRGVRSRMTGLVSYAHTEGADVDVGDRVELKSLQAMLNGSYDISEKTQVGVSMATSMSDYESYDSYTSTQLNAHLDYAVTPKITLGVEGGYNGVNLDAGGTQDAIAVSGRFKWQATAKLGMEGTVGVENRKFADGGGDNSALTYNMSFNYSPRIRTRIRGDVYRSTNPSVSLVGSSYHATGVTLALEQEMSARVRFSLAGGYERASYFHPYGDQNLGSGTESSSNRTDNYFFARPQLTYVFNERFSITVYYQHTKNESTGSREDSFARNQTGLHITFAF